MCIYARRFGIGGESVNEFERNGMKRFLFNIRYISGRCIEDELKEKYW